MTAETTKETLRSVRKELSRPLEYQLLEHMQEHAPKWMKEAMEDGTLASFIKKKVDQVESTEATAIERLRAKGWEEGHIYATAKEIVMEDFWPKDTETDEDELDEEDREMLRRQFELFKGVL